MVVAYGKGNLMQKDVELKREGVSGREKRGLFLGTP